MYENIIINKLNNTTERRKQCPYCWGEVKEDYCEECDVKVGDSCELI